jgi:transcriptional regulator with XRE-family HTH domain
MNAPEGSLGARIRAVREKAGISQSEMAARVGLKVGNISKGELKSTFSEPVLRLLAMELKDSFGVKGLEVYAKAGIVVHHLRAMTPTVRKKGLDIIERLSQGETLPYAEDPE